MYRDRRDARDIPITLRLSENQFLKVRAVSERRGTQFAATVRDLLMEAVSIAEDGNRAAAANEDHKKMPDSFNSNKTEEAACRHGKRRFLFPPIFTAGSPTSRSGGESPSMRSCATCSPSGSR